MAGGRWLNLCCLCVIVMAVIVVEARPSSKQDETSNSTSSGQRRGGTATSGGDEDQRQREKSEAERVKAQNDARRKRAQKDKQKFGHNSAKTLMRAGETDECDWTKQPIPFLKGELCGAHYKVLGLDRKGKLPDKTEIKKAYRQRSLEVHPDKNPSPEAAAAFKVVQDAYECLSDERCKEQYEYKLERDEERITYQRQLVTDRFFRKSQEILLRANYYATMGANYLYQAATDVWEAAGELEIELFDEPRPVGKWLLGILLFWKARFLLKIYGLSYTLLRVNHELAQTGFFEQFQGF